MAEEIADTGELFQIKHRFTGAVLFEAKLSAEIAACSSSIKMGVAVKLAVKAGADLADANLAGADLADADLVGANLVGAILAGAILAGANLADANLARANLADANLAGANLARANLAHANLPGANLVDANLARANLPGASAIISAGQPNGFWAFGYREKDTGALRVKVGCRDKSIAEAREYWSPSHGDWPNRREIPAALDMIEVIAWLRGWSA